MNVIIRHGAAGQARVDIVLGHVAGSHEAGMNGILRHFIRIQSGMDGVLGHGPVPGAHGMRGHLRTVGFDKDLFVVPR